MDFNIYIKHIITTMKHIKKFETFDFSQTIPVTTKNFLTNYYSCDECNGLWKELNKESHQCKLCGSNEIEELEEDEWYEISKSRGEDMSVERSEDQEGVNLYDLKKDDDNYVN